MMRRNHIDKGSSCISLFSWLNKCHLLRSDSLRFAIGLSIFYLVSLEIILEIFAPHLIEGKFIPIATVFG